VPYEGAGFVEVMDKGIQNFLVLVSLDVDKTVGGPTFIQI
jgi:hypothetical protein